MQGYNTGSRPSTGSFHQEEIPLPDNATYVSHLQAAKRYVSLGLAVVPLWALRYESNGEDGTGKWVCTCGRRESCKPGKHPHGRLVRHGHKDAGRTALEVEDWWASEPEANIGMVIPQGVIVLDLDARRGDLEVWAQLEKERALVLPHTWMSLSGSGGGSRHVYLRASSVVKNGRIRGTGIEARVNGHQVVWPSRHESGHRYMWVPGCAPWEVEIASAPPELLSLIVADDEGKAHNRKSLHPIPRILAGEQISEGERNNALTSYAGLLHATGAFTPDQLFVQVHAINQTQCRPPLPAEEVRQLVASVSRYPVTRRGRVDGADTLLFVEEEVPMPPLPEEVVRPVPMGVLPAPVRRYVEEAAEALSAPPDYVLGGILAALSVAVGCSREIILKPDWRELPCLWIVNVGPTGVKKTPAASKALLPVFRRQEALCRRYQARLEEWKQAQRQYQENLATWKRAARKGEEAVPMPTQPERPVLEQVIVSDTTIEALADVLSHNPRGILLYRDELAGWVQDMCRYTERSGERQHYLSAWASQPMVVNRRNRPDPLFISRPFVAVFGGVPVELLPDLRGPDNRHDGFLERFLFIAPAQHPTGYSEQTIRPEAREGLLDMFGRLWSLEPEVTPDGLRPVGVPLSSQAAGRWREWHEEHARLMDDPDLPTLLQGAEAKMPAQVARLALLLHLARHASGETSDATVDIHSLEAAIALGEYFRSHARRVYGELSVAEDPVERRVVTAVKWLRRKGAKDGVTARDMLRSHVAGCRTAEDAIRLLQAMAARGYGAVQVEEVAGGRRVRFLPRWSAGGGNACS